MKWFINEILSQKSLRTQFYELTLKEKDLKLYFRSSDEFGHAFQSVLENTIKNYYYLEYLSPETFQEIQIDDLLQDIIINLTIKNQIFHEELESSLVSLVQDYLTFLIDNYSQDFLMNKLVIKDFPSILN